jgi:hypothetical protein
LSDYKAKHKSQCKSASSRRKVELSNFKPDWMTSEQDKRYFAVDFRKKVGLPVEEQYARICEAIWPNLDTRGLNIRKSSYLPHHSRSNAYVYILGSRPGDMVSKGLLTMAMNSSSLLAEVKTFLSTGCDVAYTPMDDYDASPPYDDGIGGGIMYDISQVSFYIRPSYSGTCAHDLFRYPRQATHFPKPLAVTSTAWEAMTTSHV